MKKIEKNFSSFFNIKSTIFEKKQEIKSRDLFFEEHFEEIRQRFFQSFFFICFLTIIAFLNINTIVEIIEKPASNIKFFQLSPGEYFLSTLEISFYFGLIFSSPVFFNQLILFLFPSFNKNEKEIFYFLLVSSISLFFISLFFSFFVLIPATLGFFISYGKNNIEPLISFNQYIGFIGVIVFSTGLLFQIPVIQVLLTLLNILSGKKMLENWKIIIILSTIISAIFTPSADPLTQILLASVLILLYFTGAIIATFLKTN